MKRIGLVLLSFCMVVSCSDDPSDEQSAIDSSGLVGTNMKLVGIDSFTVAMATFKIDSFPVSPNRILAGRYVDPEFGVVETKSYLSFYPLDYDIDENTVFDSLVLNLPYDGYYYNDTLKRQKLFVREVTRVIKPDGNQTSFYNTSVLPVGNVVGQKSFSPRISRDSLTIRLSDAFGAQLFERMANDQINEVEQFRERYKGFQIAADPSDDAAIVGYNLSGTYMRLYFSDESGTDDASRYVDFKYTSVNGLPATFNSFLSDRTGTLLSALSGNELELPTQQTQKKAYMQAGTGIVLKVAIPHIRTIRYLNDGNGVIYSATLTIGVKWDNTRSLPDYVNVYIGNANNRLNNPVLENGELLAVPFTKINGEFNEYQLNIPMKTYLKSLVNNPNIENYGLLLVPYSTDATVSRAVFTGPEVSQKTKLRLVYALFN